jgi:dihydrofolate synthase/folylpolyglutamate synthase
LPKNGHIRTFVTREMDYAQTLQYLYHRLPMFHRIGKAAYKADLDNTLALCAHLGNPERKFKSVHVAGTNGKGSTSHLLAAALQSAGYRTGLYTSPHLKSFTERIRIDGREIERGAVVDFVAQHQDAIEGIKPSFFEMTVGMAFDYFARQQVDIAVIEVGLGGRLDSTNVITPLVSLITNISYDHQDILGNTLAQIASEKAGIIKPAVPAVIGEHQDEVTLVFREKALQAGAPVYFATDQYRVVDKGIGGMRRRLDVWEGEQLYLADLTCQLLGEYQLKNIPGVLQTLQLLGTAGFPVSSEHIRTSFASVTDLTGLKGRWQILKHNPLTICDTGHNEGGLREVVQQLAHQQYRKLHFVFGTVKDKDLSLVLPLLPRQAQYYFCQADIPRAYPATELREAALQHGLQGIAVENVNDAIREARRQATSDDLIFIAGSTFIVAEIDDL